MNTRNIQFVGGPKDGQRLTIPGDQVRQVVQELKPERSDFSPGAEIGPVPIVEHYYELRHVNGIAVRLPSGLYAMDHVGQRDPVQ